MSESGFLYGKFVDPVLEGMRTRAAHYIQPGQHVLDVACGTGAQLFAAAEKVGRATGIDHSMSMIQQAKKTAIAKDLNHIDFILHDVTERWPFNDKHFDVVILSLALHQFSPEHYSFILKEMSRVAEKMIFIDYSIPLPDNLYGAGSKIAEFLAGREHFKNFRQYKRKGGLNTILPRHKLYPREEELFAKKVFHLAVCY